jgi:hypothetical protein
LILCAEAGLGRARHPGWIAILGLLVLGAVFSNLHQLRAGERGLRSSDVSVRASLGAVELAASTVSPAFLPDPANAPQVTAGPYLAAVRDLGSPAFTLSELQRAPAPVRQQADATLQHAERLAPTPSTAPITGTQPVQLSDVSGTVTSRGMCDVVTPPGGNQVAASLLVSPGRQLVIQISGGAGGALYLWRVAGDFPPAPAGTLRSGGPVAVAFPVDRAPSLPWHARFAARSRLLVCLR